MTRYVRPADVGVVVEETEDDGVQVYLAPLPDGPVQVLNGAASVIWLEATDDDSAVDLADRVADLVGERADDIRADVDAFVGQLLAARLLEPVDPAT